MTDFTFHDLPEPEYPNYWNVDKFNIIDSCVGGVSLGYDEKSDDLRYTAVRSIHLTPELIRAIVAAYAKTNPEGE